MLSPIESFAHCYKAVTLQDTQISSDGRAITSQLLGKLGDALLCFTPKNTLQKHILSDLQTTGCKSSVIDLSERLRCVADSCACTGKCPLHDVSIYPHLANVKGLSELRTQKCDRRRRCSGTAPLTGERAQRDLARASSRSFGQQWIRQGSCARTPSRTLRHSGISHWSPTRTPSSLRLLPGERSHFVP